MNAQATAEIKTIIELAVKAYPVDHEFTAYAIHTVINGINEYKGLAPITPQPIYGKIKTFLGIKSMKEITLNQSKAIEFLIAYFTGGTKAKVSSLADAIRDGMAAQVKAAEVKQVEAIKK